MTKHPEPQLNKTIWYRIRMFLLVAICSCAVIGIFFWEGCDFLNNLTYLRQGYIAIEVSSWDIPSLLFLPGFIALTVGLFFRLVDLDTQERMDACIKVAIAFGVIFIVARVPYGFIASNYVESKGYTFCRYYTSASIMSSKVWVKDPSYCIQGMGRDSSKLMSWLEDAQSSGIEVSQEQFYEKAQEVIFNFENRH